MTTPHGCVLSPTAAGRTAELSPHRGSPENANRSPVPSNTVGMNQRVLGVRGNRSNRRALRSPHSGSIPCHQKWLGSKFTRMFVARRPRRSARSRRGCRRRRRRAVRGRSAPTARTRAPPRTQLPPERRQPLLVLPVPEWLVVQESGTGGDPGWGHPRDRPDGRSSSPPGRRRATRPARPPRAAVLRGAGQRRGRGAAGFRPRSRTTAPTRARPARRPAGRAHQARNSRSSGSWWAALAQPPTPISIAASCCSAHQAKASARERWPTRR